MNDEALRITHFRMIRIYHIPKVDDIYVLVCGVPELLAKGLDLLVWQHIILKKDPKRWSSCIIDKLFPRCEMRLSTTLMTWPKC